MALLLLALLLLTGCGPASQEVATPTPTRVTALPLQTSDHYPERRRYTGRVVAPQEGAVGFELAGRIASLHKARGDTFATGELLATLDTRLLEVEARELAARLGQNRAELTLARQTLNRLATLRQRQFSSDQEIDEWQGKTRMLEASASQIAAAQEANQVRIEKSRLLAPFSGTVVSREQPLGAVVSAGQPLFTLIRTGHWEADIGIPAELAATLSPGQSYPLQAADRTFTARLINLGIRVDGRTHTRSARFALGEEAAMLAEGQLISLLHQTPSAIDAYVVPLTALTQGIRGGWTLYVATRTPEPTIVSRDVRLLQQDGERAWIEGALQGDERIVMDGLHKLVPGQRVTVQETTP